MKFNNVKLNLEVILIWVNFMIEGKWFVWECILDISDVVFLKIRECGRILNFEDLF